MAQSMKIASKSAASKEVVSLEMITTAMRENAKHIGEQIDASRMARLAAQYYTDYEIGQQTLAKSDFRDITSALVAFLMFHKSKLSREGPAADYAVYALTEMQRLGAIDMILGTPEKPGFLQLIELAMDIDDAADGFVNITTGRIFSGYKVHGKFDPRIHIPFDKFDDTLDDSGFAQLFKAAAHILSEMFRNANGTYKFEFQHPKNAKFVISGKPVESTPDMLAFAAILNSLYQTRMEFSLGMSEIWHAMSVANQLAKLSSEKRKPDTSFVAAKKAAKPVEKPADASDDMHFKSLGTRFESVKSGASAWNTKQLPQTKSASVASADVWQGPVVEAAKAVVPVKIDPAAAPAVEAAAAVDEDGFTVVQVRVRKALPTKKSPIGRRTAHLKRVLAADA